MRKVDIRFMWRDGLFLSGLFLAKGIFLLLLYRHGFLSVSADEYARGIRAAIWAERPLFDWRTDVLATWLPLEKYVNGAALWVWHEVIWMPRVTVFVASGIVLTAVYLFTWRLFRQRETAVFAAILLTVQPWYIWLSGTPMLEMYYLACFIPGLVLLWRWLYEGRIHSWLPAAICFMLATAVHVQSWTFVNLVNLFTVGLFVTAVRRRDYGQAGRLIGLYLISNAIIITFSLAAYALSGQLFAFLSRHTDYSRWFYGGYQVSVAEKLAYYPTLLWHNLPLIMAGLVVWGVVALGRDWVTDAPQKNPWTLTPLALAGVALALNSVLNLFSGPPSAAPDRYALFYLLLLTPYAAYGTFRLWPSCAGEWGWIRPIFVLLSGLSLLHAWQQAPQTTLDEAALAGRRLHTILDKENIAAGEHYLVELRFWDYLAVQLTAEYFTAMVLDREFDMRDRNKPSLLWQEDTAVYQFLRQQHIQYALLYDADLSARAAATDFLIPLEQIGAWQLFQFQP